MCRTHVTCTHSPQLIIEKMISSSKFRVFLAKTANNNKQYAVKAFQKDEYSHTSFIREKRIHSTIHHPNIVKYIPDHLFQIDISHFTVIFMEYAPYGDFFNLILDYDFSDEKLIRTYFHQLIEGLKYLHSRGIAHLDIKLENLLLGDDFQLKISDFDLSQQVNDDCLGSRGTANYRAPEMLQGSCTNFCASDVYSAGVCLYTLMTGAFPFIEEGDKIFRYDTFTENNEEFWAENTALIGERANFSQNFKDLLNKMWAPNPAERLTVEGIMESKWYNEPIYTPEELNTEIKKVLKLE